MSYTTDHVYSKSLIKCNNNVGSKAVPLGTPESIVNLEDVMPFNWTCLFH